MTVAMKFFRMVNLSIFLLLVAITQFSRSSLKKRGSERLIWSSIELESRNINGSGRFSMSTLTIRTALIYPVRF